MLQQQYRLFAGIGDVEASESHAFGHKNEIRQSLGPESERLQIDQPVKHAQALSVALAFVQQRGSGFLNSQTDQPGQRGDVLSITSRLSEINFFSDRLDRH